MSAADVSGSFAWRAPLAILMRKKAGISTVILCCCISFWVRSDTGSGVGYAVLTVEAGKPAPAGAALFTFRNSQGDIVSEAGVPAAEPILHGRLFVDQNGAETGIALVNPSGQNASVVLLVRDLLGNPVSTGSLSLDPGNHIAKFVSELIPGLPAGFRGTLTFDSDQALAGAALRLIRNAHNEDLYTALPIAAMSRPALSDPVVFPQVAAGGGYVTSIVLINTSALEERGRIDLFGDQGTPLPLRLGHVESAEFAYAIPSNGACVFDLEAQADMLAGYAVVTPEPGGTSPAGTAIFRMNGNDGIVSEAGVAASALTTAARVFVDNVGSYTGVALVNAEGVAADVTLTLLTTDGDRISNSVLSLPAFGHAAKFVHEMFPESVKDGFTGVLEIRSPQPYSATTLRLTYNGRHDPILTTLPFADLMHPSSADFLLFPQIAIGGGFSTRLILINPDDTLAASGTLSFFDSGGAAWNLALGRQIGSRFPYVVPPRGSRQQVPVSNAPIETIAVLDSSSNLPTREIAVNEGNTLRPKLLVVDTTGAQRDDAPLSFVSIDTEVATVTADGAITGRKAGFSTLAISSGGVVATATIAVATVSIGIGGHTGTGIAQDSAGRLYLAATQDHTILLAEQIAQVPVVYAGLKATPGFRDGPRLESLFRNPSFLSLDKARGTLYVSDGANNVVRKVQPGPDGRVETLAGTGATGSRDGSAGEAEFNNPQGACIDGLGNLWVVDSANHTIRRINLVTGVVETIAGKAGAAGSADGIGTAARFNRPVGIASETDSINPSFLVSTEPPAPVSMIVADSGNGVLRRVKETGEVRTIGSTPAGDGDITAAIRFNSPTGVAVDPFGNIYVAETNASQVKLLLKNRDVVSAAQNGTFISPAGLAISQGGKVIIADSSSSAKEIVYGAPQITSVSPEPVSSKGGDTVTVYGANFSPETIVALRGILVSGLRIESTQKLTFTAPAVAGGLNTLTIQNRGGLVQRALLVTPPSIAELPRGYITTVAGGGNNAGDGGPATEARVAFPTSVAVDSAGNVYISENNRVRRVDARTGIITAVIGTGESGVSGDGELGVSARLRGSSWLAFDAGGNLCVSNHFRIRRLDMRTGIIDTIAGTGVYGFSGDNGPARAAQLMTGPIAFDSKGNLFIADAGHRIRRVDAKTQIITTLAGTGKAGNSGDGGPATEAQINWPQGIAVDPGDNIYITSGGIVRRIDANTGIITTVVGGGTNPLPWGGAPLPATSIFLDDAEAIAFDAGGNLYISAQRYGICRVDASTQLIRIFANFPSQTIAFDAAGNLFHTGAAVLKMDSRTKADVPVAGTGELGHSGDNGPAIAAEIFVESLFGSPFESSYAEMALDRLNNLYVADRVNRCIRRIDAETGIITTVYNGAMGGIAVDPAGNLFLASQGTVLRLHVTGELSRVAGRVSTDGDPEGCEGADGKSALDADLGFELPALAIDPSGGLVISDLRHHRIRRVQISSDSLTTLAGTGSCVDGGLSGDGGPATQARLNNPWDIIADRSGNIFISDWGNGRIRKVDAATGIIDTLLNTTPRTLFNLAIDDSGNIFFVDFSWQARNIVKIETATGRRINITSPSSQDGTLDDNIPASKAKLITPADIILDPQGNLWIADPGSGRVRVIRGPL